MTTTHGDGPTTNGAPRREQPVVSVVSTSTSTALRVDYDGRHAPLELFFVWTSLGWHAPVPASPPRDAIDWSTPDVGRGTNHTILPFRATGTATLDTTHRVDLDEMVTSALDAAKRLGCRVDMPAPVTEIDLRDDRVESTPSPKRARTLTALGRRNRGALARVRAIVPESSMGAVTQAARTIDAEVTTEPEPLTDPEAEPRHRVTFEVPASAADAAMRVLTSLSTGTPTIEIVTARSLTGERG